MHKLAARSHFLLPAALAAAFVFFAALANPVSAVGVPLSPGMDLVPVDAEKDTMLVPTDWGLLPGRDGGRRYLSPPLRDHGQTRRHVPDN